MTAADSTSTRSKAAALGCAIYPAARKRFMPPFKSLPGKAKEQESSSTSPADLKNSLPVKIRLLIVDDHQVVRVGLRTILERYPTIGVVGDAGDLKEAVEKIKKLQPDVVLLDVRLGDED